MGAVVSRQWDLPNSPESIKAARAAVCEAVGPTASEETREIVALLVSEVVTNAFRHGGGTDPVTLRLVMDGEIHVEVCDSGEGFTPTPRIPDAEPGGWGLYLVGKLAREWGTRTNSKTRVWFRLPLGADHPAGAAPGM